MVRKQQIQVESASRTPAFNRYGKTALRQGKNLCSDDSKCPDSAWHGTETQYITAEWNAVATCTPGDSGTR